MEIRSPHADAGLNAAHLMLLLASIALVFAIYPLAELLEGRQVEFLYLAIESRHDEPSILHAYFDQHGDIFKACTRTVRRGCNPSPARTTRLPHRRQSRRDRLRDRPPREDLPDRPGGRLLLVYNAAATTDSQMADDFRRLVANSES